MEVDESTIDFDDVIKHVVNLDRSFNCRSVCKYLGVEFANLVNKRAIIPPLGITIIKILIALGYRPSKYCEDLARKF